MKNLLKALSAIICMIIFVACAQTVTAPVETAEPSPLPEPAPEIAEYYTAYKGAKKRPVAVMIDNDNSDAWPHAGLSEAYLVYEITVEGMATRLMALFDSGAQTEKIGPIRSSRHYFLDYALEHDAIYAHLGWSPKAQSDISSLGINNLNGLYDTFYWRENKYAGDYHSAFASMEKISEHVQTKGYRTEREKAPLNISPQDVELQGDAANSLSIKYAHFYGVQFEYDEESGAYRRFLNNSPHALQENAEIRAKNIIVIQMKQSSLGDGSDRINIYNTGSGEGYFITGGRYIPITWSKESRQSPTEYKDMDGNDILLNPGQTWIQIIDMQTDAIIK